MADNILINQGTATTIRTDQVGTVHYQVVKLDVGADGLTSPFTGTIGAVTNLAAGTVTSVANLVAGTITSVANLAAGTITKVGGGSIVVTAGTVETAVIPHIDYYQAQGTIAGTATGTAKAKVTGSAIYVTDVMISTNGATDVTLCSGTTTIPIWGPLHLAADGGVVSNFVTPIKTTSGSALVYNQTGAGTITVAAQGYVD